MSTALDGSTILNQNVHRAQARGPKVFQWSGGGAPAEAARTLHVSFWTRLMSAAHSRAQRNDFNVHLDSAGDSFGATAQGGLPATHFARRRKMWERCAHMKMRALKCCTGHSFEPVDFEQA